MKAVLTHEPIRNQRELMYNVEYMSMGKAAGAFVVDRGDNQYTIVLNSDLPQDEQQRSLKHEIYHIRADHFNDLRPIAEVEAETEKNALRDPG